MTYAILDKKYLRPSMIIFCEDEPVAGTGGNAGKWELGTNYLYITDDGRSDLSVSTERIEYRQRMINGRMRKYHVTDKKSFSTSWSDLPSRKTRAGSISDGRSNTITSDAFAAGNDIKEWYETYTGDFWVILVFDNDDTASNLANTVSVHNVFFDSFNFSVTKRGQYNDLWNVDISLVEA